MTNLFQINTKMDLIDFSKPTIMCDVILVVENKKLYCNRAILSIWSPVFETMFKSNFKEKESSEVNFPGNIKNNLFKRYFSIFILIKYRKKKINHMKTYLS